MASSIEGIVRDNKIQESFRLEGNGQHNRHPRSVRMPVVAYAHRLLLLNKHYE